MAQAEPTSVKRYEIGVDIWTGPLTGEMEMAVKVWKWKT